MENNTKKIRISDLKGKRWVLVVHGASETSLEALKTYFQKDEIACAAVAYETGIHGIHPHWQVYFQTTISCRMKLKLQEILGSEEFHLELARGTKNSNLKYVYSVNKDHEIGWILYEKNSPIPVGFCQYKRDNLLWLKANLKPWQKEILDKIQLKADFRDILWVWEPEGNTGKTYLAKYLHYFYGAIITGGKGEDMKHAIARWKEITGHYPVTIIIDLARSDNISKDGYKTIEEMKNALFFSGKYQSGMVASVNPPHIIIFANIPPTKKHMSLDRWDVRKINPITQILDKI